MNEAQVLIDNLESAPQMITNLVREVPTENLKRRPSPGKWSAHEHACHISTGHDLFHARLELMLSEPDAHIASMQPSADEEAGAMLDMDIDEALRVYAKDRARLVERLKELSPNDWQRTATHEAYSRYSVFIMFRDLYLHEMLHAYRIQELLLKKEWEAN
jgi:uncharacterized damage-inducible protein DinB